MRGLGGLFLYGMCHMGQLEIIDGGQRLAGINGVIGEEPVGCSGLLARRPMREL